MAGQLRLGSAIYSWESCLFKIDNTMIAATSGKPWGIVALDYEQKRERKVVYRNRPDGKPAGKTVGKYSVPSCTLKMLKASAQDLRDYLASTVDGVSYGDAEFTMLVQVFEPVVGAVPITVELGQVTIDGEKDSHEEGIDELVEEFELGVIWAKKNGKQLWSAVRGIAGNLL